MRAPVGRAAGEPQDAETRNAEPAHPIVGLRPAGDRAVLVELRSLAAVLTLTSQLAAAEHAGDIDVVDVVAAATTVLIVAPSGQELARAAAYVRALRPAQLDPAERAPGRLVRIETVYDGADLDEAARLADLSPEGLVAAHTQAVWDAAFGGFAPGFTYLTHDAAPSVPRRTSPRTAVPAGSVAVAGTYSAVYPGESPGGWQLIGRTDAPMWDLGRDEPALVQPGDRVQFAPVRESATVSTAPTAASDASASDAAASAPASSGPRRVEPAQRPSHPAEGGPSESGEGSSEVGRAAKSGLVVVSPGLQTTVQDLGRPGRAALGVSPAGALDRGALRRANRIVGNGAGAAGLESLFGGLELRAAEDQVIAVTGARVPLTITTAARPSGPETPPSTADDPATQGHDPATQGHDPATEGPAVREAPLDTPFALLAGETLAVGAPTQGLRTYVAVRGGFDVPHLLGSASADSLSGIGPAPLAAGDTIAVLPPRGAHVVGFPEVPPPLPGASGESTEGNAPGNAVTALRVIPGPRQDWFTQESLASFAEQEWTVTPQSNRVGVRLDGTPLARSREGELVSEGTVRGAIQVPASGLPVLFLADAPVTGGYPVIGVVVSADLDLAAQLPPGAKVRFVPQNPQNPQSSQSPQTRDAGTSEGTPHA
ncbi:carboxyltransferase domain-containing protein [Sinomonas notoginsengisoli]|uniref:5-oxoprolinase subunit B/C family protein n=1 Tax=Sinomonas notoginsengisoli TaxID=1457311 RepID=UPI001F16833D|nr:carboxyltransferase domain-containing protein [Sinomonas notoginsengisoli]